MKKEEKGLSIPLRISIIIISKGDLAAKQQIVHKEVLPMERMDVYITAYRLINKYNAKTKQPKTFGTAETVCGSEAQVLDVVAHTQLVTCSQIASALGITKGAVSQTLAKLEKKALIERAPCSRWLRHSRHQADRKRAGNPHQLLCLAGLPAAKSHRCRPRPAARERQGHAPDARSF